MFFFILYLHIPTNTTRVKYTELKLRTAKIKLILFTKFKHQLNIIIQSKS